MINPLVAADHANTGQTYMNYFARHQESRNEYIEFHGMSKHSSPVSIPENLQTDLGFDLSAATYV